MLETTKLFCAAFTLCGCGKTEMRRSSKRRRRRKEYRKKKRKKIY